MGTSLTVVLRLGQIPVDPQSNEPSQSDKQDIVCMCFSPSEETLVASTSKNQLYGITMSLTEISKVSLPPTQCFLPAWGPPTTGAFLHPDFPSKGPCSPF